MTTSADQLIEELMSKRPPRHKERAVRVLMIKGLLTKPQVQMWVKQLHYYRVNVPRKELYILAHCPVKEIRMERIKIYGGRRRQTDRGQGRSPRGVVAKVGRGFGDLARRDGRFPGFVTRVPLAGRFLVGLCAQPQLVGRGGNEL